MAVSGQAQISPQHADLRRSFKLLKHGAPGVDTARLCVVAQMKRPAAIVAAGRSSGGEAGRR